MQQRDCNQQKTVNKRLKHWECLKQIFTHNLIHHDGDVFRSVAVITQLAINSGEKLMSASYKDPPYK
jgi:hypothetical protein